MFKYEEYPTINEAHKKYRKLERKFVNLQIKYDKSGSEKDSKKFDEAIRDAQLFGDIEYGKIVFDVFKVIKPDIKDKKEGTIYKWDELYGQDFEQLSPT